CSCRERHNSSTVIGSIENRADERGIPSKVLSSKASAHSRTQGNKSATEEWKPVRSVDRYQNRPSAERSNLSGSRGNVSNNRVILKSGVPARIVERGRLNRLSIGCSRTVRNRHTHASSNTGLATTSLEPQRATTARSGVCTVDDCDDATTTCRCGS